MPKATRSRTKHFVIGQPTPLSHQRLPTKGEALSYVRWLSASKKYPTKSVFRTVAKEIRELWTNEGIPVHDLKYITEVIKRDCYKPYRVLNKTPKGQRQEQGAAAAEFHKLLDIAKCKCKSQNKCKCPADHKVPQEFAFLKDQRRHRSLTLGSFDRATTAAREARATRRAARRLQEHPVETDAEFVPGSESESPTPPPSPPATERPPTAAGAESGSDSGPGGLPTAPLSMDDTNSEVEHDTTFDKEVDDGDELYTYTASETTTAEDRNFGSLTNTALAVDRYGISNRAASAIINAFQQDNKGELEASEIVDPKKIWRARAKVRKETAHQNAQSLQEGGLTSLYFDGRKDRTFTEHRKANTIEEHVVVISEPGGSYVTHFTPESGRALHLLNELYSVSQQFGGEIKVLGCDGTAVNTGTTGGVCRLFELVTGSPVHWFICQLHGNELNLRHLFQSLDGTTSGPRSFSGPIGRTCAGDVWESEVVAFEPVPGHVPDLPPDVVHQLSTDQQLLHQLASAVQSGSVDPATARRRIGPLNHAR